MEIVKDSSLIQNEIERFVNKDVYIHLETTNGAYASHFNEKNDDSWSIHSKCNDSL